MCTHSHGTPNHSAGVTTFASNPTQARRSASHPVTDIVPFSTFARRSAQCCTLDDDPHSERKYPRVPKYENSTVVEQRVSRTYPVLRRSSDTDNGFLACRCPRVGGYEISLSCHAFVLLSRACGSPFLLLFAFLLFIVDASLSLCTCCRSLPFFFSGRRCLCLLLLLSYHPHGPGLFFLSRNPRNPC